MCQTQKARSSVVVLVLAFGGNCCPATTTATTTRPDRQSYPETIVTETGNLLLFCFLLVLPGVGRSTPTSTTTCRRRTAARAATTSRHWHCRQETSETSQKETGQRVTLDTLCSSSSTRSRGDASFRNDGGLFLDVARPTGTTDSPKKVGIAKDQPTTAGTTPSSATVAPTQVPRFESAVLGTTLPIPRCNSNNSILLLWQ